jgi:hypothetical protein
MYSEGRQVRPHWSTTVGKEAATCTAPRKLRMGVWGEKREFHKCMWNK